MKFKKISVIFFACMMPLCGMNFDEQFVDGEIYEYSDEYIADEEYADGTAVEDTLPVMIVLKIEDCAFTAEKCLVDNDNLIPDDYEVVSNEMISEENPYTEELFEEYLDSTCEVSLK